MKTEPLTMAQWLHYYRTIDVRSHDVRGWRAWLWLSPAQRYAILKTLMQPVSPH